MAITQVYVDYGAGNDTTGDGTIGTPWKTLQKAFDTLTRNTTDGNQVNLKAGTAHVNAAALDLTTFIAGGALSAAAPLLVRGYTSAANDGGVGEIDCGGYTMFAGTTYTYVYLVDLKLHNFGDNNGVVLAEQGILYRCEVYKGASSPSGKKLVSLGTHGKLLGCYLHDIGAGNAYGFDGAARGLVAGNYVVTGAAHGTGSYGLHGTTPCTLHGNIVLLGAHGTGVASSVNSSLLGNAAYSTVANTGRGIYLYSNANGVVLNNIAVGFSGAGGSGISANSDLALLGYNAFYNCTTGVAVTGERFIDLTGLDVALAADPFTDAANGDFSLTAAAKAALRGVGWPAAYLGAHANTDGHITIGPVQYGEAEVGGGGRPAFGDRTGGKF